MTAPIIVPAGQLWERLAEWNENVEVYGGYLVEVDYEALRSGRGSIPGYGTPPGEYMSPIKPLPDWYVSTDERGLR